MSWVTVWCLYGFTIILKSTTVSIVDTFISTLIFYYSTICCTSYVCINCLLVLSSVFINWILFTFMTTSVLNSIYCPTVFNTVLYIEAVQFYCILNNWHNVVNYLYCTLIAELGIWAAFFYHSRPRHSDPFPLNPQDILSEN